MKILALENELPGLTTADFVPHLKDEARRIWDLQQSGAVREVYFTADRHTAVLVLECGDAEACKKPDFLKPVHGDAHKKNIRTIQKKGITGFMAGKRNW